MGVYVVCYADGEYGRMMVRIYFKNESEHPIDFGPSHITASTSKKYLKLQAQRELFGVIENRIAYEWRQNRTAEQAELEKADGRYVIEDTATDTYGRTSTAKRTVYDPEMETRQEAEIRLRYEEKAIDLDFKEQKAKKEVSGKVLHAGTVEPGDTTDGIIYIPAFWFLPKELTLDIYVGADVHQFNFLVTKK